ncbi:protein takeout-like [Vanessa cardui]|uniref:protein takeout-like n=1 Tax=Vanessa cardui TaxID=171605 RepID=UPI001F13D927|nr:protein takeout-like [Vanessa cardui]
MLSYKWLFFIALFVILSFGDSKVAPDYIILCPGLKSECLKKSIQETIPLFAKGVPSLGINSTDPLYKDSIAYELPGKIKVKLIDSVMTGLRNCVIDSVMFVGLDASVDLTCGVTVTGKYKATGQILLFSLNGDGEARIKTPSMTLSFKAKFEDRTRNGIIYREIKEHKVVYKYNEKVDFVITNLFKGNPEISQAILKFMNENWQVMVNEFGKPLIDKFIRLVFDSVKKFFHAVPRDEIFV